MPDYSKMAGGLLTGMHSSAMDAIRYPGLGANYVANKLGLRSNLEAQRAANAINEFADNPPHLNKSVRGYMQERRKQNPVMSFLGGLASPGGGAKAPTSSLKLVNRVMKKRKKTQRPEDAAFLKAVEKAVNRSTNAVAGEQARNEIRRLVGIDKFHEVENENDRLRSPDKHGLIDRGKY